MHLLLTNDDGIDAPGLQALERAARTLYPSAQISVVAPASEQSMCGHCVTTRKAIRVDEAGDGRWAVHGPSADCVRIALFALNLKPDWVLSGVNAGGNMGQDIVISGTLAAAREAAYHGLKAAAFSHYLIRGLELDWQRVSTWTHRVFETLLEQPLADAELWNVNFPHLPPGPCAMPALRHCKPERQPLDVAYHSVDSPEPAGHLQFHYTASYADRPRAAGSDVEVCFGGGIAVSKLHL